MQGTPDATVGEYVIEARLGEGGFGTVYRAVHPVIGKRVAIKILSQKYSSDPNVVSRFLSEARAVNQIRHQNIVDIFSFGELPDGRRYFVMEYLEGETLEALIRRRQCLEMEEALAILEPLARALDAAHDTGIAHRDLKPANVMVLRTEQGEPSLKLLDFGIAKLLSDDLPRAHRTASGAAIGTPDYMSPEQVEGRDVDHRTDTYSFGVMAYRMLVGRLPFEAASSVEMMIKHLREPPPPLRTFRPEIPDDVDRLLLALLAKDRSRRPDRLMPWIRDLRGAVSRSSETDPRAFATTMPPVPRPGRRPLAWIAVVAGLLLLSSSGWLLHHSNETPEVAAPAAPPAPLEPPPVEPEPSEPDPMPPPVTAAAPAPEAPKKVVEKARRRPEKKPVSEDDLAGWDE